MKNPKYVFSATLLATSLLCFFANEALAQGTVAKQSKCRLLLEGVSAAKVGSTVTITLSDGSVATAKIKNFKAPRAIADIDPGKCNVNALGARVVTPGAEKPSASAPSKGKKSLGLGVAVEGGWGSMSIDKEVGDQKSLAHAGPEVIGTLRYAHAMKPNFLISVLAGGGWHQKGISVSSLESDGTTVQFDLNTVSTFVRMGAGGIFAIKPNLRLGGYGIFDYGFSGKYEMIYAQETAGYTSPSYPLESFMRYGAQLEFDYNVVAGLWVGAGGNLLLGSITLGNNVNSDTTPDADKGLFGTMTYSGVLKLSYEL